MNATTYLHVFAWIAIIGLVMLLAKTFLLPVAITAALCFLANFWLTKK